MLSKETKKALLKQLHNDKDSGYKFQAFFKDVKAVFSFEPKQKYPDEIFDTESRVLIFLKTPNDLRGF